MSSNMLGPIVLIRHYISFVFHDDNVSSTFITS